MSEELRVGRQTAYLETFRREPGEAVAVPAAPDAAVNAEAFDTPVSADAAAAEPDAPEPASEPPAASPVEKDAVENAAGRKEGAGPSGAAEAEAALAVEPSAQPVPSPEGINEPVQTPAQETPEAY